MASDEPILSAEAAIRRCVARSATTLLTCWLQESAAEAKFANNSPVGNAHLSIVDSADF